MAEVVLAAATVLAVAAVAVALPAVLRAPADRAVRTRLTPTLVIVTGSAVISFAAYLAYTSRCGHRCERGAGTGFAGLHDWWRTRHSWQWDAQLEIAAAALAAGALAFALAAYGRRFARPRLARHVQERGVPRDRVHHLVRVAEPAQLLERVAGVAGLEVRVALVVQIVD